MYLKSIEIHGFKSFANKLVFEFQKGITAIVGPNGSGKSNVGDAVRWVLGEQSAKQLRGSKMEDIIFAGTELRKPQGFAYVAITFDNSDHKLPTSYDEVTVARRVYRSGESEYLMNGVNCRLRDVQELFLDTGIGKEGYSIIGQGQIDKILNGKPEERRELFDEAAGIVKFKKRKATAEKNLEVERQNLERITDILSELEKQVGPLKEQSEIAREYLRLREQLKRLDVNLFLQEYQVLHGEEDKIENNLKIVTEQYNEKEESFAQLKEEYSKLERELEQRDIVLEQNKSAINEKRIHEEQLEGSIKVCHEQILAAKQNDSHYQERLSVVASEIQKKKEEKEKNAVEEKKLDLDMGQVAEKKAAMEQELEECKEQMKAIDQSIDQCNANIMENLNQSATLKAQMEKYNTMYSQSSVKKSELTQRILRSKTEEAICLEVLQTEEKNLEKLATEIDEAKKEQVSLQKEQEENNQELEKKRSDLSQQQQQYHREKSRMETLKNMTERYEGYGQSIRRVMEQKERNAGIIGVVADIIKVNKQYEVAIEIALGGSIQNIVTDNENTAKQLIQFLKKNKYGRATFLPLTTVGKKGGFQKKEVLDEKGVLGVASELVEVDNRFHGLVEYLLGRIVVVDHIDHALEVARKYNHSFRMVTLEGELLNPGGALSGGAYKNSSNLLSRRREIEDSEKKLTELQTVSDACKKRMGELQTLLRTRTDKLREVQAKLQELYLKQNTSKLKYDQAKAENETISLGYQLIHQESEDIELQFAELKAKIAGIQDEMKLLDEKNKEQEDQIALYNKNMEAKKKEEEHVREKMANVSVEVSSYVQKREFASLLQKRMEEEIVSLREEHAKLQQNAQEAACQVKDKEEEILSLKQQMEEEKNVVGELTTFVEQLIKEREEIAVKHKGMLEEREKTSELLGNLDKEIFRLNNQKEKLADQIENRANYMWEEYELTYGSAQEQQEKLNIEVPEMRKQISQVKTRMKGLGDVNVNAIEDYRAVSERYEMLHTQHEDLIRSEEVLLGIVEELDQEMRKQFEERFAQIKTQFDMVFKELFGGGKGTITLAEGEDILEAGINIIAQPPGKKLQNMMQMSGGEKALTAISLLFAIQNLKPSPFCLLDEIEAALDDSNVKRYAQYLHKLTKDTQFIVITHRRGTMAAADVMYGITMQEKGVSTMVSVNLIEDQLNDMEKAHSK